MKESLTFVIFGGTGDLAKRKLAPAFSELIHKGTLKKGSTLIGISRKKLTDEGYRKLLIDSVKDKKEKHHLKDINIRYLSIDFSKGNNLKKLADVLPSCEVSGCNRIYYLATGYKLFPEILKGLNKYKLISKQDKYNKIVFEKPFGQDMKSSDRLDKDIHKIVDEKMVFRIDHYLGKESVQNIVAMKYGSKGFQHLMNKDGIKQIDIIVDEELGVGNRLGYYDNFGAIKDMIQNHLLQLLALILMDKPRKMKFKYIHDGKVKVLKSLTFNNINESLLGQYSSYQKELGSKSDTETFAKISLESNIPKYKGVKIFLRTGKKLPKKYGQIVIKFKDPKNKIVINLQPKSDVEVKFHGKKIKNINFCPKCTFRPNSPSAYEILIKEMVLNHIFNCPEIIIIS